MKDYYDRLDQLGVEVYSLFNQLLTINQNVDITDPKLESSKLVRTTNSLLLTYKELLHIIQHKTDKNDRSDLVKYQLYESKFHSLKNKSQSLHLYSNNLNDELIHKQRVKEYALAEEPEPESKEDDTESAREKLFSGRSSASKKATEETVGQQVLSHNKQITSSLQSSKQLLTASVIQSELNIESLDQQTKDLRTLNEDFMRFNDLLGKSKQIVKFIERQDKSDRRRIYMGIGFFMLCIAWVIYRRILRTPIRLLFWSFFKIFRIFNWVLVKSSKQVEPIAVSVDAFSSLTETATTAIETFVDQVSSLTLSEEIAESSNSIFVDEIELTISEFLSDEL
ncbi:Sec20-domain-containing protein [Scheffersomyces coipomensis]|uniref:Sec20-domain-containing protein n=1 Tax=Scheffersomyces coipomensis TaxID=1788519 RepID=UPI00315CAC06